MFIPNFMIAYLSKTGVATQLLLLLLKDYHRVFGRYFCYLVKQRNKQTKNSSISLLFSFFLYIEKKMLLCCHKMIIDCHNSKSRIDIHLSPCTFAKLSSNRFFLY